MDPGNQYEISAFYIFATIFLVLLNGFFVAAEFAMVRVRGSQIEIKAKSGSGVAKIARGILHNLDGYLAATQLGITIASLALGVVGEEVVTNVVVRAFLAVGITLAPALITTAHILSFVVITVLHIVFGELAPKSLAIQKSVRTVLAVSWPLRFFFIVFKPFIWVLNGFANFILKAIGITSIEGGETHHSSEELQYLLEQGKETGAIDSNEHELIQNVFDFNERVVKNIMVPRTKIQGIEIDAILFQHRFQMGHHQQTLVECALQEIQV
ncbi:MAG: HlyC/CorC family transporter, partial [Sphingobacteriales bacterium]